MADISETRRDGGHRTFALTIAALVFAADQLVKYIVISVLRLPELPTRNIELLPIFDLTWVENRGVSMGFLVADSDAARWLLVALTAGIAAVVFFWMLREKNRGDTIALAFVLGGALGNIVDRARYGYVADFADLHFGELRPFLIFNVGDAAITIGVLLLLFRALLTRDRKAAKAKDYPEGSNHA